MGQSYSLKIDAYSHIVPSKYKDALYKVAPQACNEKVTPSPALYDLEFRFRIMDRYGELVQVLTLGWPPVEEVANPQKAAELAKLANDEMAELVLKYPERFVAAIACLPMNNMDAALQEADRAINDLRFRGVYVHTPVNDKPLDSPEFMPLYEKMSNYNLPIFIHPMRPVDYPDYKTEDRSMYGIFATFGWPYETTLAMTRLVFSGVLEKYPNIKFVTHHCGGMVPYYAQRIADFKDLGELRRGEKYPYLISKPPIEYFKMFYNDTAIYGNTPALMCAYAFWGVEHMLFGADFPLGDSQHGFRHYRQTVNAIEQMEISDADKKKIFEDNARALMRLPV